MKRDTACIALTILLSILTVNICKCMIEKDSQRRGGTHSNGTMQWTGIQIWDCEKHMLRSIHTVSSTMWNLRFHWRARLVHGRTDSGAKHYV